MASDGSESKKKTKKTYLSTVALKRGCLDEPRKKEQVDF